MNVVIYARYSSHSQTEQSLEGQLQTCYDNAKNKGHIVIGEYIDKVQSGTTDNRAEFQRMIADSDKHTFEAVLVYQLDRFARNRYDSAINKAKLKKNGVRVLPARENISDDASGILVEGVLESMAEYYSAELSQKIRRGMNINAEKCLSNGSNPGLGCYVDKERRFHIDPEGVATVREIFELYASSKTVTEIITNLNSKQSIEDRVVSECRKLLTDSNFEKIVAAVAAACEADYDSSAIRCIKAAIQETDAAIENLWKALGHGQAVDMITERIEQRHKENMNYRRSSPLKGERRSRSPLRRSKPF